MQNIGLLDHFPLNFEAGKRPKSSKPAETSKDDGKCKADFVSY